MATRTTILDMFGETQGQSHQISNFSIGPDGKLYVHMGDGFDTSTGQNLNSFRGKILGLNLDGSPATNNPFYNAANGITATDYVFAYGLRNPFGCDWRAADGFHYEVENGPSVDRFAKIVAGRNYLYNGSDNSMTNFALYTWSPISGSTRKLHKQKGTGGSRKGDIKSPVFRGGGTVFGPNPRDYSERVNKKVKVLARKSALSEKAILGKVVVIEDFSFRQTKNQKLYSGN